MPPAPRLLNLFYSEAATTIMSMKITIEISSPENSALSESAGELSALWGSLDDLDRGLAETHCRLDALEARLAPEQARLAEPAFDSDVDDTEL